MHAAERKRCTITLQHEFYIKDVTCDGLDFNRTSKCCSGQYISTSNAYDNSAGMYFYFNQILCIVSALRLSRLLNSQPTLHIKSNV